MGALSTNIGHDHRFAVQERPECISGLLVLSGQQLRVDIQMVLWLAGLMGSNASDSAAREPLAHVLGNSLPTVMMVLVAAALLTADSAIGGERHRLVLQVADQSQLSPAVLACVQSEVATIYDRIGVDVIWIRIGADAVRPASKSSENDTHTFSLVILSRETGSRMIAQDRVGDHVMGRAFEVARRAYIFTHRVRAASARQPIDFQKLLGQVIAHEIGHLLRIDHSRLGIMQPGIQVRTNVSQWFTPTQGAAIRVALR